MLRNGNDERVQKSFRELRDGDETIVPSFDRVWRTARAAADPQRAGHGRLMVALAMVAIAAVASALTIVATQPVQAPSPTIASEPVPLAAPAPASASGTISAEPATAATPAAAADDPRPTTVSDTPARKSSKPSRSPRRQKHSQSVPCVEC